MNLLDWLSSYFGGGNELPEPPHTLTENDGSDLYSGSHEPCVVNPANGLPMIVGTSGVDIEGNSYGMDSPHDHWSTSNFDHYGSADFGSTDSLNTDSFDSRWD